DGDRLAPVDVEEGDPTARGRAEQSTEALRGERDVLARLEHPRDAVLVVGDVAVDRRLDPIRLAVAERELRIARLHLSAELGAVERRTGGQIAVELDQLLRVAQRLLRAVRPLLEGEDRVVAGDP